MSGLILYLIALVLAAGCRKTPPVEIPPPAGVNTHLVWDGMRLVWREVAKGGTLRVEHADYYPAASTDQSVSHPGNGWSLPPNGNASVQAGNSAGGWRSGHLAFAAGHDTAAYLEVRLHHGWDNGPVGLDLLWWNSASSGEVRVDVAYDCSLSGGPGGNSDPQWTELIVRMLGAPTVANTLTITPIPGLVIAGKCIPGSMLRLRVRRTGTNSADTFGANWLLDGITLRWAQML